MVVKVEIDDKELEDACRMMMEGYKGNEPICRLIKEHARRLRDKTVVLDKRVQTGCSDVLAGFVIAQEISNELGVMDMAMRVLNNDMVADA